MPLYSMTGEDKNALDFDGRLANAAVIGAGGKMGRGIALVLALELAKMAATRPGLRPRLCLVEQDEMALQAAVAYIETQAARWAEKNINALRALYAPRRELVENAEMVEAFTRATARSLAPGRAVESTAGVELVFEAVHEDEELKARLLARAGALAAPEAWFLTNTSSIPIAALERASGLSGRLMGFHFYNPPAVQKLVELIPAAGTRAPLRDFALALAGRLGKTAVPVNDVAGFIGNGQFIREAVFAIALAGELSKIHGEAEAYGVLQIFTRDWLLRPMGVLQVVDYIGLDVFSMIAAVMEKHGAGERLTLGPVPQLLARGIVGGLHPDGRQRDGFYRYGPAGVEAVVAPSRGEYQPLAALAVTLEAWCGPKPAGWAPWSRLQREPGGRAAVAAYLEALAAHPGAGGELARRYLDRCRAIAEGLLAKGAAQTPEDVDQVMTLGFNLLYGPCAWKAAAQ